MSERIPNPFRREWENFDREEFKDLMGAIIDDIIACTDEDQLDDLVCDLDDQIANLILTMRFKDLEYIEVVRLNELSKEKLLELGFEEDEIAELDNEAVIPLVDIYGFNLGEFINEDPPKKKDKKDWMI